MKKVLSFVLVFTLVLSSFSMAFAATPAASAGLTDITGNANEDAIQVNFDLGIVTGNPDGTFLPDKAVTRAEFAAMLTRALAIPDSALAGYTSTSFRDTTGYSWAVSYLAFCQSKGILLGDGAGNVMPGRTITVNEAMTMALRAIGYTANSSLLVGAWPANYVSIAQNNSLYDDVATTTTVNKASAAQIIYNLLTVQKVAVNTDGTTDYLWDGKAADGVEANLLNTNLGCDSIEDAILGSTGGTKYDDAIINITGDLGAYGTAYTNSDDEVVAFTKDSTALTGKINDDKDGFEVGDVTYDISDADMTTTDTALFANGTASNQAIKISIAQIQAYAAVNSDDGETVTLNVDLSGKTINDVYSVVAWKASSADKAASDVQEDIADKSLLSQDFVQTDDDVIDMNSFELNGVASLDKIAEDNVVYVYVDNSDDIRKVAVGTETVVGTVDEVDDGGTITIADKDYDVAPATIGGIKISDINVDDNGTFYLDANGEVYDFDGTSGTADTYGIVKAATAATDFDNFKIKLYKSDDSTSTVYLSESKPADIDWVTNAAQTSSTLALNAVTGGALVGYSLDNNGDVDTLDVTAISPAAVTFQSVKVLKTATSSFSIDSNAVVFTYKNDPTATGDYGVSTLADVSTGLL
ncbi:MAG TPA: S-layer homology domain-containing protein, partial [Anaerovoracaceae bacterium]|nr:S-layer homology domain-containing protein [Anaerovoracaceae bacterium]